MRPTRAPFAPVRAQLTDAGDYDVVATAVAGSTTSNAATLSVSDSAPQITSQPSAATLAVGGNTIFAIGAVGSGPLTYQWRRDGVPLAGATAATLAVVNAQTFDAGLYTVGTLEWAWSTPPAGPVTFTYTVSVPAGTAGEQLVAASGLVRFGGSVSRPVATPSPLWVPQITPTHSADTSADFNLSLFELTRVIELYNTRLGTTRTGRYQILHAPKTASASTPSRPAPPPSRSLATTRPIRTATRASPFPNSPA